MEVKPEIRVAIVCDGITLEDAHSYFIKNTNDNVRQVITGDVHPNLIRTKFQEVVKSLDRNTTIITNNPIIIQECEGCEFFIIKLGEDDCMYIVKNPEERKTITKGLGLNAITSMYTDINEFSNYWTGIINRFYVLLNRIMEREASIQDRREFKRIVCNTENRGQISKANLTIQREVNQLIRMRKSARGRFIIPFPKDEFSKYY